MIPGLRTAALLRRLPSLTLVDALGAPYYATGHLPGALNIPPHHVQQRASALLPDRDAAIVVYGNDAASTNAHIVLDQLAGRGYTHLFLYVDGIEGWVGAGLPVEQSATAI